MVNQIEVLREKAVKALEEGRLIFAAEERKRFLEAVIKPEIDASFGKGIYNTYFATELAIEQYRPIYFAMCKIFDMENDGKLWHYNGKLFSVKLETPSFQPHIEEISTVQSYLKLQTERCHKQEILILYLKTLIAFLGLILVLNLNNTFFIPLTVTGSLVLYFLIGWWKVDRPRSQITHLRKNL